MPTTLFHLGCAAIRHQGANAPPHAHLHGNDSLQLGGWMTGMACNKSALGHPPRRRGHSSAREAVKKWPRPK
ncbi:hypothetical protein ACO0KY_15670 [Undibacterium sp. Dicai25W]|uniref:hypothetical protein n=1 Tax=Undibacterium sp. Dicai25W TaxID=3413034 RepID=UPI003BF27880